MTDKSREEKRRGGKEMKGGKERRRRVLTVKKRKKQMDSQSNNKEALVNAPLHSEAGSRPTSHVPVTKGINRLGFILIYPISPRA